MAHPSSLEALGAFAEAVQDLVTAGLEIGLGRTFACADACNQAVEKALQAVYVARQGRRAPYDHDLAELGAGAGVPPDLMETLAMLSRFHPETFYAHTPPELAWRRGLARRGGGMPGTGQNRAALGAWNRDGQLKDARGRAEKEVGLMVIVWLALIGAVVVTAIVMGARFALSRPSGDETRDMLRWAGTVFVVTFVLNFFILYTGMPALTGPYGGWQWLLWPLLVAGGISMALGGVAAGQHLSDTLMQRYHVLMRGRVVVSDDPPRRTTGAATAGIVAISLALVIGIVINSLIVVFTTWFDPNAKALAAIPNIQVSSSPLPPTNVQHIVLVTQNIAAYRGQQVLAQSGQNLGSIYHLETSQYTLQAVDQHLYWIAPLVYNNIFSNLGNYNTPGYVVVDAENPDAPPQLRTGYHMHYVPGALLNQDLIRHVYLSGYTYGDLADPTLEVRDDWRPFYTISLMQPSRGFTGEVLHQVLLVDPQTGDIQTYAPAGVPSWVDRVVPASVVTDYLTWWGLYHAAPWFNPSGQGQQQPVGDPELVYNDVNQPVWLIPMTSSSASDNSSTGVMLFDTKKNSATFYNVAGLGVGSNVTTVFASNPTNIRNYDVSTPQLYSIYGRPTWVAIFSQANSNGATFQAVGLVAADDLSGNNVQMASSLSQALTLYSQWLAAHPKGGGTSGGPSSTGNTTTIAGKVLRIAPATQNGQTIYYVQISGSSHIFTASLGISPVLPLVQPGDSVTGTYLETGQVVVALTTFADTSIVLATPTPAAVATPVPVATATP